MNTKKDESNLIVKEGYRARSDVPAIPASMPVTVTPMDMLKMAVSQGADLAKMEQLMALQERWEANEARKAFYKALSGFKAEGITVGKDSRVTYKTDKGVTDYVHASLGNICNVIGPALARYGLSTRWVTAQVEGRIKVTCVLSHELGHSEEVSLEGGADSSGGKNNIQAVGSTVSYLERYTLLAITGTATEFQDDDGGGSEGDKIPAEITKPAIPTLSTEEFTKQKVKWKTAVVLGKKDAAGIIAWVNAQNIATLTAEQIVEIKSWTGPKAEPKLVAKAPAIDEADLPWKD